MDFMKKLYLLFLVAFTILVFISLLFSPALRDFREGDLATLKDSRKLKEKFLFLYQTDPQFRESVDRLREMLFDPLEEFNKTEAWILFNLILEKMGLPKIELEDFRYGRGGLTPSPEPPPELKPCCENCVDVDEIIDAIVIPVKDLEEGNGLEAIYVCAHRDVFYGFFMPKKVILEVTLVFSDEDSPFKDIEYDLWRLIAWGRVEDIETFFIIIDEETGDVEKVSFKGLVIKMKDWPSERRILPIGSRIAPYTSSAHDLIIFESAEKPLTIYVNTWNHALSLNDNNLLLAKRSYSLEEIEVRIGRRIDAENDYSMLKYSSQRVQSPP